MESLSVVWTLRSYGGGRAPRPNGGRHAGALKGPERYLTLNLSLQGRAKIRASKLALLQTVLAMQNDTRKLTIHSLPRLSVREVVSYKGEPHEVLSITRTRSSVIVRPVDGGKKIKVTRNHLEERAGLYAQAQRSLRKAVRSFRESNDYIVIKGECV